MMMVRRKFSEHRSGTGSCCLTRGSVDIWARYAPNGRFVTPGFDQARRWWYQWYMNHENGAAQVRGDPVGFARIQWDSW